MEYIIGCLIIGLIVLCISIWRFFANFGRKHRSETLLEHIDDVLVVPGAVVFFFVFGFLNLCFTIKETLKRKTFKYRETNALIGKYVSNGGSFPVGNLERFENLVKMTNDSDRVLYIESGRPSMYNLSFEEMKRRVASIELKNVVGYVTNLRTEIHKDTIYISGDIYLNALGKTMYNLDNIGLCLRAYSDIEGICKIVTWDLGYKNEQ